ncbi:hypothetical protein HELRODRAFT_75695, partial [Helobdella robusta]|uniref:GPI transamidase component PIG-S n=1 Tax=Helobdella robusta TaxID=6412 RepID=T1G292_HELRO
PILNFVVYIPTRQQSPLNVFDQSGKSRTNSFLVPRWGGIIIKNVETPPPPAINKTLEFPFDYEIQLKELFSVVVPQLKVLLGFKRLDSHRILMMMMMMIQELDVWLTEHTIENIGKSSATLNSLSQLLNHISNIVINDDVGDQVYVNLAVSSVENSLKLLKDGSLKEAYLASRQALQSSEKAFFDPSLLELLYFPEDQKFAIYIPLFLPVGIPVVCSAFQAFKYFKNKKFGLKQHND